MLYVFYYVMHDVLTELGADVTNSFLAINGTLENFEVGPLIVSGLDGAKQAVLQVQVGKDVQHLLLDGTVTLYDETYPLRLRVDVQSSPGISFKMSVFLSFLSRGSSG